MSGRDLWRDIWTQVFLSYYLCLQADVDMATSFNLIMHTSNGAPLISINQNQPHYFQKPMNFFFAVNYTYLTSHTNKGYSLST